MTTIRLGVAQLRASQLGDSGAALADVLRSIDAAAAAGAELLVLPECAYPAYCLGSAAAYRAAPVMSNDAFIAELSARALRHRMHIVCGFVEDRGDALANAAVLVDDRGERVGVYRKTFLWGDDNDVFAPGEETRPFETRFGKIGIIICADARAPETVAAHAAQGAELICVPTCWVNVAKGEGQYYNPQPDFLIPARAREFGLPFVCANKFGRETESIGYCGQSLIVDHTGRKLAEAPADEEAMLVQEISLQHPAVTPMHPKTRAILQGDRPPVVPDAARTAEAAFAVIQGRDILSFAEARAAAIQGAAVLLVSDAPDELAVLRARAAENRVYVMADSARGSCLIAPDGGVLATCQNADRQSLLGMIEAGRAADKLVFPKTHIWEQRRPKACRAAFET